jgi:hypothetical protein
MKELYYISKKNKKVNIEITTHAKIRFFERYNRLFPHKNLKFENVEKYIIKFWKNATIKPIETSSFLLNRSKKYKGDSLYFKSSYFTFVIENGTIVTIEVSSKNMRHLNNSQKSFL